MIVAKFITGIIIILLANVAGAAPLLNFSDITSGPKTWNTDGVGSGAIVTIWGNNLGSTQGSSKVYVGNVEATAIYYWKDADGDLPGGPADLKTYHKMQEIAFSIPSSAVDGANAIKVVVDGLTSNTLPFTVRTGNIYFIKSTGNDSTGNGSWSSPWLTLSNVLSGNGKLTSGDIVYTVGVGATGDVNVGYNGGLVGTSANPFSVIAYPNTTVSMVGATNASFRNWTGASRYLVFSKFTIDTGSQAFSATQGTRYIGNNIIGPIINVGASGWVGGGCAGASPDNCGGQHMYGNEVHDYGKNDGTVDQFHHLFYISNRSGYIAEGYKIGWNYLHDNPIYQGIHVYDQEDCGSWSGSIDIHHNVVKNQGGNSINVNFNCSMGNQTVINIFNNLTITDTDYNLLNRSAPAAPLRIEVSSNTEVNVYNNTFFGYAVQQAFTSGQITYRNNVTYDNRAVTFTGGTPGAHSNNLFYSTHATSQPSWATSEDGHVAGDPLFTNAASYNFSLQASSPAVDAGYDVSSTVASDFLGFARSTPLSIGAFEYIDGSTPPSTLPTSFRIPGGVPYGIVQ